MACAGMVLSFNGGEMNDTPPDSRPPILSAAEAPPKIPFFRQLLAVGLSLCLWLFVVDGLVSLADDTAGLLFHAHPLAGLRMLTSLLSLLLAVPVYFLMGLTPMVPKKFFLPLTLFVLLAQLAFVPAFIYFSAHWRFIVWLLSLLQAALGLVLLWRVQGGCKFHALPFSATRLTAKVFSWKNLFGFVLLNFFLVIASAGFLVFCTGLGIGHFSEGFMALRPAGLSVQKRTYVRADGKTVQLYPMGHVADAAFYQKLSRTFPSNSVILMEGVSDEKNLLTNGISYVRMARKLGLSEQHEEFKPESGELVRADVDVDEFSPDTIALLNLVMLIHTKGLNAERLRQVMKYSEPENLETELLDDLLHKRNRHLLKELATHLPETDLVIIPWGVAHMPEVSREIQKSGFHLTATEDLMIVRFHHAGKNDAPAPGKNGGVKK